MPIVLNPTGSNRYDAVKMPERIPVGKVWLEPLPGLPGWYWQTEYDRTRQGPERGRMDAMHKAAAAWKKKMGYVK